MSKKDLTWFVRFGGLNAKHQKGFGDEYFHSPPAPRGFYAMPLIAQDHWLLGTLEETQPDQFPRLPEDPTKEDWANGEFSWAEHEKKSKKITRQFHRQIRKEFRKVDGHVWHHLGDFVDNNEVEERRNAWVKTSLLAWRKAFSKCSINNRYGVKFEKRVDDERVMSINAARGIAGKFSTEHFEVFFDEKV